MQSTSVGRHQGNRFAQGTTPARTYLLPVHLRQHPVHRNEIPEPGGPTNPKGLRVLRRCQNNGATKQGVALPGGFLPNREVSHELLRIAQSIERPKSRAKRLKQTLHYDLLFETNGGNNNIYPTFACFTTCWNSRQWRQVAKCLKRPEPFFGRGDFSTRLSQPQNRTTQQNYGGRADTISFRRSIEIESPINFTNYACHTTRCPQMPSAAHVGH